MTRPRPRRKHDRVTWSGASREDIAVDHAILPFDQAARLMDARWGIDRLPALVSPETAARYGRTLGSLNAAIEATDEARATDRAQACIRGMAAMEAEARAAGHVPPTSGVLEADIDGFRFGILPDPAMWRIAEREHPGLPIYTLREISVLLRAKDTADGMVAAVKSAFPCAEVTAIRPKQKQPELPTPPDGAFFDDELPY
jgi:hypothetical protein